MAAPTLITSPSRRAILTRSFAVPALPLADLEMAVNIVGIVAKRRAESAG